MTPQERQLVDELFDRMAQLENAPREPKRFKGHKIRASRFLQKLAQEKAGLFVHWRLGMTGTFA
jgi:hypothetical protein